MNEDLAINTVDGLAKHEEGNNFLLPIFLKLEELSMLIVGGETVAFEKLASVLQNSPGARIRLISHKINNEVKELAGRNNSVTLIERSYNFTDIDNTDIVIATTGVRSLDEQISKDARAKGKLVHVENSLDLSDFYLGSDAPASNGIQNESAFIKITASRSQIEQPSVQKSWRRIASYCLAAFAFMLIGHFIFSYIHLSEMTGKVVVLYQTLDKNFHWMVLAGFLAQLVDGALGMGYGVTSAAILLSTGINPAAISGSIHTAEMFASGASGYSHYKFGNVNKKLFKVLVIPGVIGAIAGAILLVFLGEKYSNYVRPVLALYTLLLGVRIMLNAFKKKLQKEKFKQFGPLAGLGGFLDSFGGGGWGPIVTTTLITKGRTPRFVIGTVSLTEFFVTLASAFTFFYFLGVTHWQTIVALILGGFIAAPIAAKLAGRLPKKIAFFLLGVLVIIWSLKILSKLF